MLLGLEWKERIREWEVHKAVGEGDNLEKRRVGGV
jgi:hypothetical protein